MINEISGKVIAFSYDKGKLNTIQYIEADTVGAKGSGDIHISPDGKFLYASNRLKADLKPGVTLIPREVVELLLHCHHPVWIS